MARRAILVCQNYRREVEAAIAAESLQDIEVVVFACNCVRPRPCKEVLHEVPPTRRFDHLIVLGQCLKGRPTSVVATHITQLDRQFDLFLPTPLVQQYQAEGAYLLTPGWLNRWDRHIRSWGFDEPTARAFFAESCTSLVLLDTGLPHLESDPRWEDELRAFGAFVDRPYRVVHVGLDLLRLLLSKHLSDPSPKGDVSALSADYAMVFDMLSSLARYETEARVVQAIFELFDVICGPRIYGYLPFWSGKPGTWVTSPPGDPVPEGVQVSSERYGLTESGRGFWVRLSLDREPLAVVLVEDIAMPDHIDSYLNLILGLLPVLALAVSNSRIFEELRDSHAQMRLLLKTIPDLVWFKDPDGCYLLGNPAFEHFLGCTEEEFVGKSDYDLFPAEMADFFRENDREAAACGRARVNEEWVTFASDQRRALLETVKAPVFDAHGKLVGVLGIGRDITAVRRAEESLRKLSRAVEQNHALIVITDLEGKIDYVNPKFTQVTGYSQDEVLGRNVAFLSSGELSPDYERTMWRTLASGNEWHGEFHNRKKNGELYWESASISPIFDAAGAITHYVAIKEDITLRRRLEEDLRQAQKMDAVGRLAGGVAHDFNNILTVILGNAELLRLGELPADEQNLAIKQISEEADRASRLTRQLLTFSRRQTVQRKDLNFNKVVVDLTRMLRRLIGEHITLVAEYDPDDPVVHADSVMIEQMLINLAVNSRDAMVGGGRISISTERVNVEAEAALLQPGGRSGRFVRITVEDTGEGIEPGNLSHIFEPFFTTKEVGRGTGLGLATVFAIVEQHQGWIEVESWRGEGTRFRIYLPLVEKRDVPLEGPQLLRVEGGGSETILLVEDEPSLRRMVSRILERRGYRVHQAESATAALLIWSEVRDTIDLVLTDVVMPDGMTGWQLGARLQADKPGLHVIYSSGYNDEMLGQDSAYRNSRPFLEKPYQATDVLHKIRTCLDGR